MRSRVAAVPTALGEEALVRAVTALFEAPTVRDDRVGLEIELFPVLADRPWVPVPPRRTRAALASDPGFLAAARVSFEPGGQLELSPAPLPPAAALAAASALLSRARELLARDGVALLAAGVHPWASCARIGRHLDEPRYRVMERHFDAVGEAGRRMMRQTASLQVCLDLGAGDDAVERWRLANRAGPALSAAFANAAVCEGRDTGLRSLRCDVWQRADPSRTGFDGAQAEGEPVAAYAAFALAAGCMPLPRDGDGVPPPSRRRLADWVAAGGERPDGDDLRHHLSTLFPPVRPRGHLEVRYLDALPERWMAVPVTVLTALLHDTRARREALEVLEGCGPPETAWRAAAARQWDARLRSDADALLTLAAAAARRLPPGGAAPGAAAQVLAFRDRYVRAGRCPADDQLARLAAGRDRAEDWR